MRYSPPRTGAKACRAGSSAITRRIRRWRSGSRPPSSARTERRASSSRPTDLRAGGAWTAQLAQEIAEADAFILLIGEHGVGKWQVPEYDEALDRWVKSGRTFPLIVVLHRRADSARAAVSAPTALDRHARPGIREGHRADVRRGVRRRRRPGELWRYTSPYRGLEAMEEKDSDYFFGRTRETVEALERARKRRTGCRC